MADFGDPLNANEAAREAAALKKKKEEAGHSSQESGGSMGELLKRRESVAAELAAAEESAAGAEEMQGQSGEGLDEKVRAGLAEMKSEASAALKRLKALKAELAQIDEEIPESEDAEDSPFEAADREQAQGSAMVERAKTPERRLADIEAEMAELEPELARNQQRYNAVAMKDRQAAAVVSKELNATPTMKRYNALRFERRKLEAEMIDQHGRNIAAANEVLKKAGAMLEKDKTKLSSGRPPTPEEAETILEAFTTALAERNAVPEQSIVQAKREEQAVAEPEVYGVAVEYLFRDPKAADLAIQTYAVEFVGEMNRRAEESAKASVIKGFEKNVPLNELEKVTEDLTRVFTFTSLARKGTEKGLMASEKGKFEAGSAKDRAGMQQEFSEASAAKVRKIYEAAALQMIEAMRGYRNDFKSGHGRASDTFHAYGPKENMGSQLGPALRWLAKELTQAGGDPAELLEEAELMIKQNDKTMKKTIETSKSKFLQELDWAKKEMKGQGKKW